MNNFVYDIPTRIYFGAGQVEMLSKEVKKVSSKALLIYDRGNIKQNGIYDDICRVLQKDGIAWARLSDVQTTRGIPPWLKAQSAVMSWA